MTDSKRTIQDLKILQNLPLDLKIKLTKQRIREWVRVWGEDGVYVSFSGGKDSTVLLHIVREEYPDIPAVFVDTGLEYPEIRDFVRTFDNVIWLKPEMNFREVIKNYGYPMISKQVSKRVFEINNARRKGKPIENTTAYKEFTGTSYMSRKGYEKPRLSFHNKKKWGFLMWAPFKMSQKCCDVMKKKPMKIFSKENDRMPITGEMAEESLTRVAIWCKHGCNLFDSNTPKSTPMSFWTEQDVYAYILKHGLKIASVYGDICCVDNGATYKTTGVHRTGCVFCGYGCHLEKSGGRFLKLKETHPKLYNYLMRPWSEGGLGYKDVIDWLNKNGNLHIEY